MKRALVIVLLGISCASAPPQATASSPSADLSRIPRAIQAVFARDIPWEGFWRLESDSRFSSTTFELRRGEGDAWMLVSYYSTDVGNRQDEMKARLVDGVLTLLEPSRASTNRFGDKLCALYPCRVNGVECLVPDHALSELVDVALPWDRPGYVFRRMTKEDAERFPAEWQAEVDHWRSVFQSSLTEPKEPR